MTPAPLGRRPWHYDTQMLRDWVDVRVVTYNIHRSRGLDRRTRPQRIAAVLREIDADIIALQEVVGPGLGGPGHAEEISRGLPACLVAASPDPELAQEVQIRFSNERFEQLRHLGFNPSIFMFCPQTYSPAHQLNARMFAVPFGVPEDPATGSANACLAAYLLRHNYFPGDRIDVRVEQGYEIARPSLLHLKAQRRGGEADIQVGGHVVPTCSGTLC